jgi:RNA polymerase sigma factor (sigma-70 family)
MATPGSDEERNIVQDMLRHDNSKQWEKYTAIVARHIHMKAAEDMSYEDRENIVQEVMLKATRSLPRFRFECTLRTWFIQIAQHCITDRLRRLVIEKRHLSCLLDEKENDDEEFHQAIRYRSVEETFEIDKLIEDGIHDLFEYVKNHRNVERNTRMIEMLLQGYNHVDIAKTINCDVGVVGYIIREAQRYARQKRQERE